MLAKLKSWLFENKQTNQTIAKNAFWLFCGQMVSRLLRAAIVIYAARLLGPASWGAFSYALGVAAFLTIFSDFGINALITKEASRQPELKNKYLATGFFLKIGLLAIFAIGVIISIPYLTNIPEVKILMPIVIFVFAFDTLRDLGSALTRALEKMEIEANVHIFTNLIIVVLGFVFLYFKSTSQSLALAYAIGSGLGLAVNIYILRDYFKNIFRNFEQRLIKPILVTAWPFGLLGLLGVIMINTDIIMIGWLRSAAEVGFYSTAQKPILLLYVLPALLATSIFPLLSRLATSLTESKNENNLTFQKLLEKALKLTFFVALPLAFGGAIVGDQIIKTFFGSAYLSSITAFQILVFTFPIVFPSTIIGNALFAHSKQKQFIGYVGLGIGSNLLANLLLIPSFGIEGAAAATVISQLFSNSFFWIKMKKIVDFKILPHLKKIFLAALLMAGLSLILKFLGINLFINIGFSIFAYIGILCLLKEETLKAMAIKTLRDHIS